MLRAALIGCGRIGNAFSQDRQSIGIYTHAEAYITCPETALSAICDVDKERLRACGKQWGVKACYADAATLLSKEAPDVVSICTPNETHYGLTLTALDCPSVKAILVEKPLATDLVKCRALVQRARDQDVLLAVNYSRRYAPSHQELRRRIQSGWIGRIQTVTGLYTKGVRHNGTHWFDLVRFLLGEIQTVRGMKVLEETGADPTLDVSLDLRSGATVYLHACDARVSAVFEMDILGTKGRVRLIDSGHSFETFEVTDSPLYSGYRSYVRTDALEGGLRDVTLFAVQDLVDCLREARQPRCTGEDALAALGIALAAEKSAATDSPVQLTAFLE